MRVQSSFHRPRADNHHLRHSLSLSNGSSPKIRFAQDMPFSVLPPCLEQAWQTRVEEHRTKPRMDADEFLYHYLRVQKELTDSLYDPSVQLALLHALVLSAGTQLPEASINNPTDQKTHSSYYVDWYSTSQKWDYFSHWDASQLDQAKESLQKL